MTLQTAIIRDVIVRRGARTILNVNSLELQKDLFFGLIGPNGAGKSTLLKILGALLLPDSGSVTLLGHTITSMPKWRLPAIRRKIAYVPQSLQFNQTVPLTTREIVTMGVAGTCGLFKRPGKMENELIDTWIDQLGLTHLQSQPFNSLSGGEQQKTLLAKAMVQEPELLLLDEPTANLDIDWKLKLAELISKIYRKNGLTIVMVSHETGYIPGSCTRIGLMKDGEIVLQSDRNTALSEETLTKLYGRRTMHMPSEDYFILEGASKDH